MLPCENRSEGNGKNVCDEERSAVFSKRKILEYLADILEDENLISPLEKIALKEKINKREKFPFTVIAFVGMSVLLLTLSAFNTRFFMLVLFLIGVDITEQEKVAE